MSGGVTIAWTELQVDALTEILNLAMGGVAHSLARMIGETVTHNVPAFNIVAPAELARRFDRGFPAGRCAVLQDFHGDLEGRALFLLQRNQMETLARTLLRNGQIEAEELADDAVHEAANVILGACMASLADTLAIDLQLGLPVYRENCGFGEIRDGALREGRTNLCCSAGFVTAHSGVEGLVVLMLSQEAAIGLQSLVTEHIRRVMG